MDDPLKAFKDSNVQTKGLENTVYREVKGHVKEINPKSLVLVVHVDAEFKGIADINGLLKIHISKLEIVA